MKRFFTLFLAVALFLTGLCACTSTGGANDTEATTKVETEAPLRELPVDKLKEYTVIYPEGAFSLDMLKKVRELQTAIKNQFGVIVNSGDDYVREGTIAQEKPCEILIGNTNRDASAEVFADLKKENDYEIRIVGEKLVIAGWSEVALSEAIDAFIAAINALDASTTYFFRQDMETVKLGTYRLDEVLMGETALSDYTLVYEDSVFCESLVKVVAQSIQSSVGYHLPTMTDATAKKASYTGKMILIGDTQFGIPSDCNKESGYYVGQKDENVYFYGSTDPLLAKATEWLTATLDSTEGGSVNMDPTLGTVNVTDNSLKVMTYNVLCDYGPTTRAPYVLEQIKAFDPDTLGVQEAGEPWIEIFDRELSDEYARVGIGREVGGWGETNCIFYKKDKFTLIESGTKWMSDTPDVASKYEGSEYIRIFTYALLERKSDGARFMHINLHPEHGSEAVKVEVRKKQFTVLASWIEENVKVPFFLTGDLNCEFTSEELKQLVADTDVETASKVAYVTMDENTFKEITIDFVLFSKGDFTVYDYAVDNTKIGGDRKVPSDHAPVMVTCDLKAK